jgi:hypothetical protein
MKVIFHLSQLADEGLITAFKVLIEEVRRDRAEIQVFSNLVKLRLEEGHSFVKA